MTPTDKKLLWAPNGQTWILRLWYVNRPALAKVGDVLTIAQSEYKPGGRLALGVFTASGHRVGLIPDCLRWEFKKALRDYDSKITLHDLGNDGFARIAVRLYPRAIPQNAEPRAVRMPYKED